MPPASRTRRNERVCGGIDELTGPGRRRDVDELVARGDQRDPRRPRDGDLVVAERGEHAEVPCASGATPAASTTSPTAMSSPSLRTLSPGRSAGKRDVVTFHGRILLDHDGVELGRHRGAGIDPDCGFLGDRLDRRRPRRPRRRPPPAGWPADRPLAWHIHPSPSYRSPATRAWPRSAMASTRPPAAWSGITSVGSRGTRSITARAASATVCTAGLLPWHERERATVLRSAP